MQVVSRPISVRVVIGVRYFLTRVVKLVFVIHYTLM